MIDNKEGSHHLLLRVVEVLLQAGDSPRLRKMRITIIIVTKVMRITVMIVTMVMMAVKILLDDGDPRLS